MPESTVNYTTINHNARLKLGLSLMEYCLCDLVYNLSNNPQSDYPQWCFGSKDYLALNLGSTKQTIHKLINKLVKQGILKRHPQTKHLQVSIDWYTTVLIRDSKESLLSVNKSDSEGKESLPRIVKKVYPTRIYTKKDTNIPTSHKRESVCPFNQLEKYPHLSGSQNGHGECTEFLDSLNRKFINYPKQIGCLHKIFRSGYGFEDLNRAIDQIERTDFYQEHGWDMATVASYLDRKELSNGKAHQLS